MTLLVSLYTSCGIVFAADSQVVAGTQARDVQRRDPQAKVQRVKRLGVARGGGVVGFYGLAEMQGRPMDEWLRDRIQRFDGAATVEEFALYLRDELRAAVTQRERQVVSGFHIGGFEKRDGVAVPVFHFLRNTDRFDPQTGEHSNFVAYRTEEHLPALHAKGVPPGDLRRRLRERQRRFPYWYRNGDLRIAARTWEGLEQAVASLGELPGCRAVDSLEGFEKLAKVLVDTTSRLYPLVWRGGAPLIGGRTMVRAIEWPS